MVHAVAAPAYCLQCATTCTCAQRPITCNGGMQMPGWYDIMALGDIGQRQDEPGIEDAARCAPRRLQAAANNLSYRTCSDTMLARGRAAYASSPIQLAPTMVFPCPKGWLRGTMYGTPLGQSARLIVRAWPAASGWHATQRTAQVHRRARTKGSRRGDPGEPHRGRRLLARWGHCAHDAAQAAPPRGPPRCVAELPPPAGTPRPPCPRRG